MTNNKFSNEHLLYIKRNKKQLLFIRIMRFAILIFLLGVWELFARLNVIDSFITSTPSKIVYTIFVLFRDNNLLYHIGVTLYETVLGFIIAVVLGYLIAVLFWWSKNVKDIFEPYMVVLNSLPKIALGPIIIVWCGSGTKAIIFMVILVSIVIATITMINGFLSVDEDKIILLKSMGATKTQILYKLIIPSTFPTLISMLKISVGMAWIGSIMGEYIVSKAGLGYLIVYGGQVLKLDLVMASIVVLCLLATLMYCFISVFEKKYKV